MTQDQWAKGAENQLLDQAVALAPSLGWGARMAKAAGRACGFSDGETELLIPHGAQDLAALLSRRHDARALAALASTNPSQLKIRERIAKGIEARIDAAAGHEAALRRWMGYLALPSHARLGLKLAWESADAIWRWAGDRAVDGNHYSKRALLAEILVTSLLVRLTRGEDAAEAHVDRRIAAVMAFEKRKAQVGRLEIGRRAADVIGRLRYGGL